MSDITIEVEYAEKKKQEEVDPAKVIEAMGSTEISGFYTVKHGEETVIFKCSVPPTRTYIMSKIDRYHFNIKKSTLADLHRQVIELGSHIYSDNLEKAKAKVDREYKKYAGIYANMMGIHRKK